MIESSMRAPFAPLVAVVCAFALTSAHAAEIDEYIAQLDTASGEELYEAIDELADHGDESKGATSKLIALLSNGDENVRWRAARTLGAIGPDAAAAVAPLTTRLQDQNALARAHSAYALGLIGEAAKPSAPNIVALVADEDATVRRAALRALLKIKADREVTRPLFKKILESSDRAMVTAVLHSMAELGAEAVPALNEALDHQDARFWATLVVQEIGPPAAPLVPKLTAMVTDDDEPEVRMHSIMALGSIGKEAKQAAPAIIEQFKNDKLPAVKYAAAFALPEIGAGEAKDALQAAVDANKGPEGDMFLYVVSARALDKLFPEDKAIEKQSVDAFIAGLQSKDVNVRRASVQALVESEAPSEIVAPRLVEAINHTDGRVIGEVMAALTAMGADAVPRVVNGLKNKDLRGYAAVVLGNIGPGARAAVPNLIEALDVDDDPEFRREVLFTLGRIGPASAPAADKVIDILKTDENDRVVSAACYALGSMGVAASKAGPALVGIYNDGNEFKKTAAIWALLKIRPGFESVQKRAIPLLIKALSRDADHVQSEAAKALGDIGPKASAAVPALKKLLSDEHPHVRDAAKAALAKIQG